MVPKDRAARAHPRAALEPAGMELPLFHPMDEEGRGKEDSIDQVRIDAWPDRIALSHFFVVREGEKPGAARGCARAAPARVHLETVLNPGWPQGSEFRVYAVRRPDRLKAELQARTVSRCTPHGRSFHFALAGPGIGKRSRRRTNLRNRKRSVIVPDVFG